MLGFLSTLQGQQDAPGESTNEASPGHEPRASSSSRTSTTEAPSFSFWGVATALTESVKKTSADLASSVRETDWRAELNAFRQGVTEESQQLTAHTAAAVEQIPGRATEATSSIQMQLAGPEMQARLAKAGVNIEKFARKVACSSGELFEDVKETILAELGPKGPTRSPKHSRSGSQGSKFSRLEADVAAMQRNSATYCEQPAASPEYDAWLADFSLDSRADEIAAICQENAFMSELQTRIVPLIVSHDMFWTRYFYRLHLLHVEHQKRQRLTQPAAAQQEEQAGWQDNESPEPQKGTAASQQAPHGAEAALQVAAAVAAHQQVPSESESGRSSGHSRQASRAATEADSEEPDVEESGKSNGEGSGSDAWSVISHPAQGSQPPTSLPAQRKSAEIAAADQQASEAVEPVQPVVRNAVDPCSQEQLPDTGSEEGHAEGSTPVTDASAKVGSEHSPAQTAQLTKPGESDDDDLSELSGSEAEGPISEAEEDWGTWE